MIRALAILVLLPLQADAACRQALAFGLDVSGSVDAREYRLQLDGLAAALDAPAVRARLTAGSPAPVRIAVYTWSGPQDQTVVLPWTAITEIADLAQVTARLRAHQRVPADQTTAIGAAMQAGFAMLASQRDCSQLTLDISGDGIANTGPRPQDIADPALHTTVVVNALVVTTDAVVTGPGGIDLVDYFENNVIRGPSAFVETAAGFADYAAAMERKILRELPSLVMGAAPIGRIRHPAMLSGAGR